MECSELEDASSGVKALPTFRIYQVLDKKDNQLGSKYTEVSSLYKYRCCRYQLMATMPVTIILFAKKCRHTMYALEMLGFWFLLSVCWSGPWTIKTFS